MKIENMGKVFGNENFGGRGGERAGVIPKSTCGCHFSSGPKRKKNRECRFEAQIWLKKLGPGLLLGTQRSWFELLPTKRKEMTT